MRVVAAATLGIVGTAAFAQGDAGAVAGLLLDPGGAVLAGVEVVLTGIDVGATHTTRTDGEGRYNFPAVPPETTVWKFGGLTLSRWPRP